MDLTLQSAFFAEMSTLLILLAGAVFLYSSFREKYLIPWIAGWTCLSFAKVLLAVELGHAFLLWTSLSIACFVLSLGLLVAGVLVYVSQRNLLLPLALMLAAALTLALVYTLWLPYPALRLVAQRLRWSAKNLASNQVGPFALGRR